MATARAKKRVKSKKIKKFFRGRRLPSSFYPQNIVDALSLYTILQNFPCFFIIF
jgi:hypothetical protein